MRPAVRLLGLAALCAMTGCATTKPQTLYYWGDYEEQIYTAHAKGGTLGVHDQIIALEADKATAAGAGRRLPPGFHAHLGYLYFEDGQGDAAHAELLAEKAAFPESATFIDRLLANMAAPAGEAK